LDTLLAYLGSSLAERVLPTIERILANAARGPEEKIKGVDPKAITQELSGEAFRDEIASFVTSDIEELLFYRNLSHSRTQWSAWAKRITLALFTLLALEGPFTLYFVAEKILGRVVSPTASLVTIAISAVVVCFCILCLGGMRYHHDKISDYRDKDL